MGRRLPQCRPRGAARTPRGNSSRQARESRRSTDGCAGPTDSPGRGRRAAVPPGRRRDSPVGPFHRGSHTPAGGTVNRVIRKSKAQSAGEVLDLLGALFSAELISPSICLWLVSPWISDVDIIDNTAGTYPALSRYGRRPVRLAEILVTLAGEGTRVVVATTSDNHNDTLRRRLGLLASD